MSVDNAHMGLIFNHPRVTLPTQRSELLAAGASRIVHVGKEVPTWELPVKQARPGDFMYAYAGVMVPLEPDRMAMMKLVQWTTFIAELHKRGGTFIEVMTGRKSNNLKQLKALNIETIALLKAGGMRLPKVDTKQGRKPHKWPDTETKQRWRRMWKSKNFASDAAVIREAEAEGISASLLRSLGPSGRND